jgi:ABC-type sugar transport system permease subunit
MSEKIKPVNQRAWLLVLPVVICVAFSAVLPLMTVVNYSVQDIISPERRVYVGTEWFVKVMRDDDLHAALWRQIQFSLAVLLIEIPLGIALALSMPSRGWKASAVLVVIALSLLIPWNVVGTIWQIFGRSDMGCWGRRCRAWGLITPTPATPRTHGSQCWQWTFGIGRHWLRCCVTRVCAPFQTRITKRRGLTVRASLRYFATFNCPSCAVY